MRQLKLPLALALLMAGNLAFAHKVTETLSTPEGDKVAITYEITQKSGKVSICFTNARKTLGNHGTKRPNPDETVVLFFDRKGGYDGDVRFSGEINTNALTIPAGLEYKKSEDGYFIIGQSTPPTLTFDMATTETVNVSVPIYLAKHPKRGRYEIFRHCGNLDIAIVPEAVPQKTGRQQKTVEYSVEYEESTFSFDDEARQRIAHINALLEFQDDSFSPELVNEIASLSALRDKVDDKRILKEIDETLERCNGKRDEIRQQARQRDDASKQEEAQAQKEAEERQLYLGCMDIQACQHYLELYPNGTYRPEVEAKLARLEAEEKDTKARQQKRTVWMIIGGALLAALLFVGNQALQGIRNIKTQRSIMEMQQDMTRHATSTAKRRTKSLLHNKTHQAMNATRNKSRDLMQKGVEKTKASTPKKKGYNNGNARANGGTNNTKTKTNGNKQISI